NIIIKYKILDYNIYNFNKTSFLIGILLYIKVIITSNYKGRPYIKQLNNYK
ncbi:hypothetical protein LX32DRAFT_580574, partial [Colletotrichum zoysiae]